MTQEPRPGLPWSSFRALFLVVALVLFILAAIGVGHNVLAWGLVALAAALLF